MTKNWQTVNRRTVSGQTVPKSWPCYRKRPCTNSRVTNWRDEKMVGWWRTEWWSTRHVGQPSERSKFQSVLLLDTFCVMWTTIQRKKFRIYKGPCHRVSSISSHMSVLSSAAYYVVVQPGHSSYIRDRARISFYFILFVYSIRRSYTTGKR